MVGIKALDIAADNTGHYIYVSGLKDATTAQLRVSANAGTTWTTADTATGITYQTSKVVVNSSGQPIWSSAVDGGGCAPSTFVNFRLGNVGGSSFTSQTSLNQNADIKALYQGGNQIAYLDSIFQDSYGENMGLTTNNATSWTESSPTLGNNINLNISSLAFGSGSTIYISGKTVNSNSNIISTAAILKSADGGTTWTSILATNNWDFSTSSIVVNSAGHIYVLAGGNLYRSRDGGATWLQVATSITANVVYMGANDQIYFVSSSAGKMTVSTLITKY